MFSVVVVVLASVLEGEGAEAAVLLVVFDVTGVGAVADMVVMLMAAHSLKIFKKLLLGLWLLLCSYSP